jgi:hypothetical protein
MFQPLWLANDKGNKYTVVLRVEISRLYIKYFYKIYTYHVGRSWKRSVQIPAIYANTSKSKVFIIYRQNCRL